MHVLPENRLEWSPGAFRLFGINPENGPPSPKGFLICLHKDDQRRWSDLHRRVVRHGGEARIEYRYLRPNGETVWVRSVARPVRGRDGTVDRLEGIVIDISGMRAMQRRFSLQPTPCHKMLASFRLDPAPARVSRLRRPQGSACGLSFLDVIVIRS